MPLVSMTKVLADARVGGYAVGYFESWDSYSLEAVVEAAEAESAPAILGFGCLLLDQSWLDLGGIETLGCIGRRVAERASVPVSLLLNEAHTIEHATRGIDAGFNAVMLCHGDTDLVAELVRIGHQHGVAVEAELGVLPDGNSVGEIDGTHASHTDPEVAAAFVAATGVDSLAVSFGNVHTLEGGVASVDLGLLSAINRRVEVPLVVHGGTSFPPEDVAGAVERGVAKFNVGTALKRVYLNGVTEAFAMAPTDASPHDLLGSHGPADLLSAGKQGLTDLVRDLIRLYGGSGQAI